jgi:Icc-related predicted phosphoesterase
MAMRIIYTSDMHGNIYKFEALKSLVLAERCDSVVIGGDIFKYTNLRD